VASDYEAMLRDIGFEDVSIRRIASDCGEECSTESIQQLAVEVTARKPAGAHPGTDLRPGVPADRPVVEALLSTAGLPADGLRTEDLLVAVADGETVGAVALERYGAASILRSLVVANDHRNAGVGLRLVYGALEVARWSGGTEVHLYTEDAQRYFSGFGFEPVSGQLTKDAVGDSALVSCCTTATAMRLVFEDAETPLLSAPSRKPLPTFEGNTCC
jgi:N-acetylglutamate synthase-like GNAT family acetyltransferase